MASSSEKTKIPFVTIKQMREVDRLMVEEYGIQLVQMMENAGRNLAELAREKFLGADPRNRRILLLAGSGGNGGGGLVCARYLHNWGASVLVWLGVNPMRLSETTRHQLSILERMGIPVRYRVSRIGLPPADLIIDALIGYSLRGAPSGEAAQLIRAANDHRAPILALDVPSGVDATTGKVNQPAIRATATLTLALPKKGLAHKGAQKSVGEVFLADLGVPPRLYSHPALRLTVGQIFAQEGIVRLF